LVILYSTPSSSSVERISNIPCLELGEVNVPTYDVWLMNTSSTTSSWRTFVQFDRSLFRRLVVMVDSNGDWRLSATSGQLAGYFVSEANGGIFHIQSSLLFVPTISLTPYSRGQHSGRVICDTHKGPISVGELTLWQCNGANGPWEYEDSMIVITGSTTTNSILISDSRLTIQFLEVSVNSSHPFVAINSSIKISFEGSNVFESRSEISSGIECSSESNISFSGSSNSLLRATGGLMGSGIGSGVNSNCNSIIFHNGSYEARGGLGAGIGSGHAVGGSSSVRSVVIFDGNITSTNSGSGGSGIGSGYGYYGNSSVMNLTILNGNITSKASGYGGSGIGSGYGYYGNSNVMNLVILNVVSYPRIQLLVVPGLVQGLVNMVIRV
jgi:hypothetical protein